VVVCVQPIGLHIGAERITHPTIFLQIGRLLCLCGPIGRRQEFLGDGTHIEIKIICEELTDFNVLMVTCKWPGILGGGCIDVDIGS
jgi:hypothetical protein